MNKSVAYIILILLAFFFITMPVTVPNFQSSTPYSMFNHKWGGISDFISLAHSMGRNVVPVMEPLDSFGIAKKTGVLLVVAPNVTYTQGELEQMKEFVRSGNTLFIADDFGDGNQILSSFNVPLRISSYPLYDFFYQKDDRFIIVARITNPVLSRNVSYFVTDEPSAIIVARWGSAFASKVAMINFHMRSYPVLSSVRYGKGHIVVLCDPDVLINLLYKKNRPFLRNLVSYLGPGAFYVDEAHHPNFNIYSSGTVTLHRVLPKDRAIKLLALVAVMILLRELGAFSLLRALLGSLFRRFFGGRLTSRDYLMDLARRRGLDEGTLLEMVKRMGLDLNSSVERTGGTENE